MVHLHTAIKVTASILAGVVVIGVVVDVWETVEVVVFEVFVQPPSNKMTAAIVRATR